MSIVHDIRICRVVLDKDGDSHKLTLEWKLEQSPGLPYKGPLYLLWFEAGLFKTAKPVQYSSGYTTRGVALGLTRQPGTTVNVKLACTENPEDAKTFVAVDIPQDSYTNINAIYDGHIVQVEFDSLPNIKGLLILKSSDNVIDLETEIADGAKSAIFTPNIKRAADDVVLTVSTRPCMQGKGWVSLGESSPGVDIYTTAVCIKSVDVHASSLTVIYSVSEAVKKNIDTARVLFTLKHGTDAIFKSDFCKPEKSPSANEENNEFKNTFGYSKNTPLLSSFELFVFHGGPHSEYTNACMENTIPLATPTVTLKDVIRWECSLPDFGFAVKIEDGNTSSTCTISDDKLEFGFESGCYKPSASSKYGLGCGMGFKQSSGSNMDIASVAIFHSPQNTRRGPFSKQVKCIGYYPDYSEPGLLRYMGRTNGKYSLVFSEKPYTQGAGGGERVDEFSIGPYHMKRKQGEDGLYTGYVLTISCDGSFTAEILDELIKKIFLNISSITPAGYYHLRDLIVRHSPLKPDLILPYYCAAKQSGHSIELRPGFMLRTESAYYVKQGTQVSPDNNGFVKGATSEYIVSLNTGTSKENTFLEMDSQLEYVMGSWNSNNRTQLNPYPVAGLVDFFSSPRSAYYRLCYPSTFINSDEPGTPRASDNICLVAIDPDKPAPLNLSDPSVSSLMLRGRTSVTVHIQIFINNAPTYVAIGTTLGSLLQRYGVTPNSIKMYRSSGLKARGDNLPEYLPVFLSKNGGDENKEFANALVLLAGDKIEV